jgi:hypothetical protein
MLSEARRRLPAARTALAIAIGDMPCSGTSQGGSGTSDRTGRIALGVIDGVDTAWTDSRELDRLERIIIAKCNNGLSWTYLLPRVLDIVDRWAPSDSRRRKLHANLRSASDDLLGQADWNKCQSHRRVDGVAPPDTRRQGGKLCRWCEDWVRALTDPDGDWALDIDMPPLEMVNANAHGMKIDRHIPPRRRTVT